MSDGARGVLLDHLASRLGSVVADAPIGNWPEAANAVLDAWEDEARTDGPRVSSFDEAAGAVRFQSGA